MKRLYQKSNYYLLLILLAAMFIAQSGCKKDTSSATGTPVITSIRSYVAHPGDSLLSKVGTGQWVVISGHNLKSALHIYFDGTAASFNDAWFSDTSGIALIPAVIAFPLVPTAQLNTVRYVTTHGETTFAFSIVPPAPTISGISNEDANPGDSVTINGFSFFFVQSVTYAGLPITGYTASNDGTTIKLVVPANVTQTGGIVSVTTKAGMASTVYKVHDFVDGVFQNWDAINTYPWGSNTSNSSTDYPDNTGWYDIIGATNMPAGGNDWYVNPHSINMGASQWIPASAVNDTLANYAVKFEISVSASTPWTNGSIYIVNGYSGNQAAYTPWKTATGATVPFTTKGWLTVTIPLSNFSLTNGSAGFPPSSIDALLGPTGNTSMGFWFMNYTSSPVVSFAAAIDNIRVVKIK